MKDGNGTYYGYGTDGVFSTGYHVGSGFVGHIYSHLDHMYDGYIGNKSYIGGFVGSCHPTCQGSCNGPYSSDCNVCGGNSYMYSGYCRCADGFYGYDCNQSYSLRMSYFTGSCHPACAGLCYGPDSCDCASCNANMHLNFWGYCVCDDGFYGQDCGNYGYPNPYTGTCDALCFGSCYGPSAYDCETCTTNAYMDAFGFCNCFAGYYGDYCDLTNDLLNFPVVGYGPTTYYYFDGFMGANHYYGGVSADCHPICNGTCSGPHASDCSDCGFHAYWSDGYCRCNDDWYGFDCSLSYAARTSMYYTGACHSACNGFCYGPDACDCDACAPNAHLDYWGYCICNDGWFGYDCTVRAQHSAATYDGYCNTLCSSSCYGPEAYDCVGCADHAFMDAYGYCNCMFGYYGDYCDLTHDVFVPPAVVVPDLTYACHVMCFGGCTGPELNHCNSCVTNSHFNVDHYCICDDMWSGEICDKYVYYDYDTYMGPCDPICDGCTGSDPTECIACRYTAHWDVSGKCVCNEYWEGDDCSVYHYTGPCADRCLECAGPGMEYCTRCVDTAAYDEHGNCTCFPYWTGDNCEIQMYRGSCDPKCVGCTG
jgi:hypothetical protein